MNQRRVLPALRLDQGSNLIRMRPDGHTKLSHREGLKYIFIHVKETRPLKVEHFDQII